MDNNQIEFAAKQIIDAVQITLSPQTTPDERLKAHEFLETSKNNTELAISCGFYLFVENNDPHIRHLGLQLLEETVRYHWNELDMVKKAYMKEKAVALLHLVELLSGSTFLKDKISRIIVEIMKHEWPQLWSKLLESLKIHGYRDVQCAEVVLLVMLRISEDVCTLQTMGSCLRRKDIYHALSSREEQFIMFSMSMLQRHYSLYKEVTTDQTMSHLRVVKVSYAMLSSYFEWVSSKVILGIRAQFLQEWIKHIMDPQVRIDAASCFHQIVTRKGKDAEQLFPKFFSDEVLNAINSSMELVDSQPLNEASYTFLKTITQVVSAFGYQISSVSDKINSECLLKYLEILFKLTQHPSLVLYSFCVPVWAVLMKQPVIQNSPSFQNIFPTWVAIAFDKLKKQGFLSDDVASNYSQLDFDDEIDYHNFFSSTRSEVNQTLKNLTSTFPEIILSNLKARFDACLNSESCESMPNGVESDSIKAAALLWEALTSCVERIIIEISTCDKSAILLPEVKQLLLRCIAFQSSSIEIQSYVLSCVSGLCGVLPQMPEVFDDVVNTLYRGITHPRDHENQETVKAVSDLKMHAIAALSRLCKSYPKMFLNIFPNMTERILEMIRGNEFSRVERVTLFASLLLVNNVVKDYNAQKEYIEKICVHIVQDWTQCRDIFSSPLALMSFVGLDVAPVENDVMQETFRDRRNRLLIIVEYIYALIHRCHVKFDQMEDVVENFLLKHVNNVPVYKNPVAPQVFQLLALVFGALRAVHGLHHEEIQAKLPTEYAEVLSLNLEDKNIYLRNRNRRRTRRPSKSSLRQQQIFVNIFHDHLCQIVLSCASSFPHEFFHYPHLAECLVHSVFHDLDKLGTSKLKIVVRVMKTITEFCPMAQQEAVVLPVIYHLAPIMLNILQTRWENVNLDANDENSDATDEDEVVEAAVLSVVTLDYLEVLTLLLSEKQRKPSNESVPNDSSAMETDLDSMVKTYTYSDSTSQLGQMILNCDEKLCESVVFTLMKCLHFPNSQVCRKSVKPLHQCLKEMINQRELSSEAAKEMFMCSLKAINLHGADPLALDFLLPFAIFLYDMLSSKFPVIKEILISLPGASLVSISEYEKVCNHVNPKQQNEARSKPDTKFPKRKREAFQRIIQQVVGKNVCEAFKREVHFLDLIPKPKDEKVKPKGILCSENRESLNLCMLFGTSES